MISLNLYNVFRLPPIKKLLTTKQQRRYYALDIRYTADEVIETPSLSIIQLLIYLIC